MTSGKTTKDHAILPIWFLPNTKKSKRAVGMSSIELPIQPQSAGKQKTSVALKESESQ
jgi:hypothetical protein